MPVWGNDKQHRGAPLLQRHLTSRRRVLGCRTKRVPALHARTTTCVLCVTGGVGVEFGSRWRSPGCCEHSGNFPVSRLCGHAVTHRLASLPVSTSRYTVAADDAPTATLHPPPQLEAETLTLQARRGPRLGHLGGGFLPSLVHLRSLTPMTIAASRGVVVVDVEAQGAAAGIEPVLNSISCPGQLEDGQTNPFPLAYSSTTNSISHPGEGEGVPAFRCRGRLRRNGCTSVLSSASAATSQRLPLVR